MRIVVCLLATLMFFSPQISPKPEPTQALHEQLKVFAPLIGKTFRGEFADSTPDKPKVDVSRWERAMNGQAVRILHSVNDGEYGGETIIMWDKEKKSIAYWYFTTAGFHTEGTMISSNNEWTSLEKVVGNANGITEVKATSQLTPDGKLIVRSQYLSQGKWEKGHEVTYQVSPDAKVLFK